MELNDSKQFIEMLRDTRAFVEMGLSIDKNPPKDVKTFLEALNELQSAAERVANDADWIKFFIEYKEDIDAVLTFVQSISSSVN